MVDQKKVMVVLTKDGFIFTDAVSTVEAYVDSELKYKLKNTKPPHMSDDLWELEFQAHRSRYIAHYTQFMSRPFGQGDLVTSSLFTTITNMNMNIPAGHSLGTSEPKGVVKVEESMLRSYGQGWVVNPTYYEHVQNSFSVLAD